MPTMYLVRPAREHLASYIAALERGWSADSVRGAIAAGEELQLIRADSAMFLELLDDREAKGQPVKLPDGSTGARIPGFHRWLWDSEFSGRISLRWRTGTTDLPSHCLGHVGYGVVPWKRGRGYATAALRLLLPEAKAVGLPFIEVTADPDDVASQRVIEAVGGIFYERFTKPPQFGNAPGLRYRICLK